MKRSTMLLAAMLIAVTVAPFAGAQNVHFVAAGSSAVFQGFAVGAYNDLAPNTTLCGGFGGINVTCQLKHWSIKSSQCATCAAVHDNRGAGVPDEAGNIWIVWVEPVGGGSVSDVWTDISVDSTVGVREYLSAPRSTIVLGAAVTTTAGTNVIASNLYFDGSPDATSVPNYVVSALQPGGAGHVLTAGLTDIRPEDAKFATNRILGTPKDTLYWFRLNYGTGGANLTGHPIQSAVDTVPVLATPVQFSLPGGTDPFTGQAVSNTVGVFPIGESPIVFVVNRSNANGMGAIQQTDAQHTSDGSYYIRNVWDQHPFPPQNNVYPSLTQPSHCTGSLTAACHVTRRPLANMFSGGDCEGDNSAFTWPLNAQYQGLRVTNGSQVVTYPITLYLREPLSGTMNTVEYSEFRLYGTPQGSNSNVPPNSQSERPPITTQESGVDSVTNNPLNQQCPLDYKETVNNEGFRVRGIGTGEVVNGGSIAGTGVLGKADSMTYTFFSFGNISKLAGKTSYGYLMLDGVDPIFHTYNNAGAFDPGQPANAALPTTWGELPVLPTCTNVAPYGCTKAVIWGGNDANGKAGDYYPNVANGTYPAWSELRMICDPGVAGQNCSVAQDPLGAESLVQHLQQDIHNSNQGGVPDFLAFDDANAFSANGGYGDAGFIRQHYSFLGNSPQLPGGATPTTTHQTQTLVDFSTEACSTGHVSPGTPNTNSAGTTSECGGDAGGFIVPIGAANPTGNLQ